ncbi:LysR family transcriptional regulator [Hoeflea olei]|uniref:LysR family transcriptional regulator n=1 Tax=Hoeflea olei TaxID=1480615 RepID=A0A1C1YVV6_9HYPH|nr:LysR family transcriptional regulator [Hoeflea olei]OCW57510.1 LysR family transcriptional regulator [Hoeflea olei]
MNETKADWADLQLFLAVAREGGLSPAARATGRSPATLGRRMMALERKLGRDLFIRHERGYELTAEARTLMQDLEAVEARLLRLTAPEEPIERPLVKVSAGTWTTLALLDQLDAITGAPADLRLRFVSTEATLDIARREVVIGFRNARPTGGSLAGRRLLRVEFAAYALPGAPDHWIRIVADTPSARWLARVAGTEAACEVTAPRNGLDLALAGRGKALLPTFIGDRHPGLERVGDTISELGHDQWIVTHQDDRHLPHVRRAIDRICAAFAGWRRA